MKCPLCGAWSVVLDTRDGPYGCIKRRRRCGNEHKFITLEVRPGAVNMRDLAKARVARKNAERDAAIRKDPRGSVEVAQAYGLSEKRVREIRLGGPQVLKRRSKR